MPFEGGSMKRISCFALVAVLSAIPAFSLTFDIKVKAKDSLQLTPLQVGLTYYIFEGGNKVLPFSEDYAIWLSGFQRTTSGDDVSVRFDMRLTEAAFIKEPPELASVEVTFKYSLKQAEEDGKKSGDSPLKTTRLKLERFSKQTGYEAKLGGKAAALKLPELLLKAGIDPKKAQSRRFELPKINLSFLQPRQ
jgi:hypothetical protein